MGQRLRKWAPVAAIAGISCISLGMLWWVADTVGWLPGGQPTAEEGTPLGATDPESVLALALADPTSRQEELAAIATRPDHPDHHRARYLLAVDRIQQNIGGQALPLLEELEADYEALAPYVLVKRGQAQRAAGQDQAAIATWQTVMSDHGEHPAAAEALYQLGQSQPDQLDTLLSQFPAHPRSVAVAHQKLTTNPDSDAALDWLRIMARHGLHHPEVIPQVDRLVSEYGDRLSPDDWQAVGFAYWEKQLYGAAGRAYAQAEPSPQTLYRAARGSQLGGERVAAIAGYQQLMATFPTAPETAEGMLKLANLVDAGTAETLLAQVAETFPNRAGEAIAAQATLMEEISRPDLATQLRQTLLQDHSDSDAAAALRWRNGRNAALDGNWSGAIPWAEELLAKNPDSDLAPEAGFWAGKWHLRTGDTAAGKARFEQVLRDYPESYFAWRSAVALGWDVGTFQTVRSLQPTITLPTQRQPLPTGSDTLQELYQLGQDQDAWELWQVEFTDPQDPTVEAQFTDGVLRLGVGDNLDGIFMVSSLSWRDDPDDQAIYQELQAHPAYGQALYPFPFAEPIARWSAQRQLNPLLVTALIRQESRFEPQIRSVVGATGLMQVMPDTADWIQGQTDITISQLDNPEDNINLGTWYLDYTHREYDDNSLFAVASYNAGPGNVANWVDRGNYADEDEFVDRIPFPETKGYVEAVFGGYWNYLRLYNPDIAQRLAAHRDQGS